MTKINIGRTLLGEDEPTYLIVEIARTYNNLKTAKKMITIETINKIFLFIADLVSLAFADTKESKKLNHHGKKYML